MSEKEADAIDMEVKEVLKQVQAGEISVEDAEQFFRRQPFEEMGYAKLDTHRKIRSGFAEVIFCSGKADEHLLQIFGRLCRRSKNRMPPASAVRRRAGLCYGDYGRRPKRRSFRSRN